MKESVAAVVSLNEKIRSMLEKTAQSRMCLPSSDDEEARVGVECHRDICAVSVEQPGEDVVFFWRSLRMY